MLRARYIRAFEQKSLDSERLQDHNSALWDQSKDVEGRIKKVETLERRVNVFKCLYIDSMEKLKAAVIEKLELLPQVEKLELQFQEALFAKEAMK